jgi:hypothetical protein
MPYSVLRQSNAIKVIFKCSDRQVATFAAKKTRDLAAFAASRVPAPGVRPFRGQTTTGVTAATHTPGLKITGSNSDFQSFVERGPMRRR